MVSGDGVTPRCGYEGWYGDGMDSAGGHVTRVLEVGTCSAGDDVMTHSELSHDASSPSPRSLQSIVLLFNTFLPKLFLNSCTKDPFIVDLSLLS